MSNFETFGQVTDGLQGSAVARFTASTTDSLAAMLAAGYLNDKAKIVKANDIIEVNYQDASNFPLNVGEAALYQAFMVQYDPVLNNWNMMPIGAVQSGIGAYNVHSADYSYAGGAASFVVVDPSINPNSVVIARFASQANPAEVKTALPGNGQLTIVASADPGVSIVQYMVFQPSVALQNAGVIAAQYSNAGGSATITIKNANITAAMVVMANFASQANSSIIKTVIAGAGTITIVATADPGVSVVEYLAVLPSSALTALGQYAAQYTNAGGSATTTIADANIKATSIVVADWASQANPAEIEKIAVSAGQIVVTSTADPGASVLNYSANPAPEGAESGVFLQVANNLSDVASASASVTNLGFLQAANKYLYAGFATPDQASDLIWFDVTAGFAALASAGKVNVVVSSGSKQYKVRNVLMNYGAAGLSGGGGDRLLVLTDGTTVYNNAGITAALLGTPINTVWGGTGNPLPGTVAMNTSTAAGANLYLQYSGGTTDYTAGSVTVSVLLQRVA